MSTPTLSKSRRQALAQTAVCDVLSTQGELRLAVVSQSMRPIMRAGDWVLVKASATTPVQTGDIVLLLAGEQLISHRVIEIGRDTIQTKGDSAAFADFPVGYEQVLGTIQVVFRGKTTIRLRQPGWRRFSYLVVWLGKLEDGLWHFLHPANTSGSLRKILDMINWVVKLPLRGFALIAFYLILWIENL
jgi:signal peptidase I